MRLFEENTIRGVHLRNRIIRSATHEGLADQEGLVTDALKESARRLGNGGVGLIITGQAYISAEGKANLRQLGVHSDMCISGLRNYVDAAHRSGAKIILQLAHSGVQAHSKLSGKEAIGPSAFFDHKGTQKARAMTVDEIRAVVLAFSFAAQRAKVAGFDGIQLHAAHGYCVSQFLSAFFNKREDAYGGSVENRARFAIEIVSTIRQIIGNEFPVTLKINSDDFLEGGLTLEESLLVCGLLIKAGVDLIELSGGTTHSHHLMPIRRGDVRGHGELYYRKAAVAFKSLYDLPLAIVGGLRTLAMAKEFIEDGVADYVGLSRPLIREPDLARKWQDGNAAEAKCVSCNLCLRPVMTGRGLYCVAERNTL